MYCLARLALLTLIFSHAAIARDENSPKDERAAGVGSGGASAPLTATRDTDSVPTPPGARRLGAPGERSGNIPPIPNSPFAVRGAHLPPQAPAPAPGNGLAIRPSRALPIDCIARYAAFGRVLRPDLAHRVQPAAPVSGVPTVGVGVLLVGGGMLTTLASDKDSREPYPGEVMRAVAVAQAKLGDFQRHKKGKAPFHKDFIWGNWMVESELATQEKSRVVDPERLKKQYADLVARARELYDQTPGSAFQKIEAVRNLLFEEKFQEYCAGKPRFVDFNLEGCANCVAQTKLFLSVFRDAKLELPSGARLGAQLYDDHIQPVLYFDQRPPRVFNLVSGGVDSDVDGPIYAPEIFFWAYVNGKRKPWEANFDLVVDRDKDLLIRAADPESPDAIARRKEWERERDKATAAIAAAVAAGRPVPKSTYDLEFGTVGRIKGWDAPAFSKLRLQALGHGKDGLPTSGERSRSGGSPGRPIYVGPGRLGSEKEFAHAPQMPFLYEDADPKDHPPGHDISTQRVIFRDPAHLAMWRSLDFEGKQSFLASLIHKKSLELSSSPVMARIRQRVADLRSGASNLKDWGSVSESERSEELVMIEDLMGQLRHLATFLPSVFLSGVEMNFLSKIDATGILRETFSDYEAYRDQKLRDPRAFIEELDRGGAAASQGLDILEYLVRYSFRAGMKHKITEYFSDFGAAGFRRPLLRPGETVVEIRIAPDGQDGAPTPPIREVSNTPNPEKRNYDGVREGTVKNPKAALSVGEDFFVRMYGGYDQSELGHGFKYRWTPELAAAFEKYWGDSKDFRAKPAWKSMASDLYALNLAGKDLSKGLPFTPSQREAFKDERLFELKSPNLSAHKLDKGMLLPESLAKLYARGMKETGDDSWEAVPFEPKQAAPFDARRDVEWMSPQNSAAVAKHIVTFLRSGTVKGFFTQQPRNNQAFILIECKPDQRTCHSEDEDGVVRRLAYDIVWQIISDFPLDHISHDFKTPPGREPIEEAIRELKKIRHEERRTQILLEIQAAEAAKKAMLEAVPPPVPLQINITNPNRKTD